MADAFAQRQKWRRPELMPRPRVCLSLFAVAEALDFRFVHGVEPCLYLERMSHDVIESLSVSSSGPNKVQTFSTMFKDGSAEHTFAVCRSSNSNIPQVWLDVANTCRAEESKRSDMEKDSRSSP